MLIFFGAPGVGKGTQAKVVSDKLNIPHISTGDILRESIKNETELGMKAKEYMDKGELVPEEIMVKLIKDVLGSDKAKNGFILDGFPRTVHQAEILQPILDELFDDELSLVLLNADDQVIVDRLTKRRTCNECCTIVNLNLLEIDNKCPKCGTENSFVKREDDEESVIKNRLDIYHRTTKPVLEFYKNRAVNYVIDGTLKVEEITEEILKAVG